MGYITPATVAEHNTHTDCWVSFLGRVFDLTKLVAENEGILTQPIVAVAGTDISHWFDARTGDVRRFSAASVHRILAPTQRRSVYVRGASAGCCVGSWIAGSLRPTESDRAGGAARIC
jgi:hypothetical protein